MRLSVVTMTRNSGGHLGWWLKRVRRYADEVVVAVDRSSTDDTYDVARAGADQVHVLELPGYSEPSKDWLVRQAHCDWALMLDDDEALPHDADQLLPPLLEDRRFTHYVLPVRWVVRAPGGGLAWLRQFPWHGPRWVRLARNLGGVVRVLPLMHAVPEVAGEGCALPPEGALALYHLDLLWHDRPTREAKVARYRAAAGEVRPTGEEHYLYEDYAGTLAFVPLPPGEDFPLERSPSRSPRGGVPADVPYVSLADLERHTRDIGDDPPIWSVEWTGHDTPARLPANRGQVVRVGVRNSSDATWRSPGTRHGRVALSYRWESEAWGLEVPVGDVTLLERALTPGEEAELVAGLWTPRLPGRYTLAWDMLCEEVAWFSARGAAPLRVPVEVVDDGPRPSAPHFPGPVHADQPADPAPTPSGAVVAMPPVRVLDTRDGTGVVEAPAGPVPADGVVVLRLAGVAGVPDDAVGVFATVSVLDAGYNGFVTAYPTDGTAGRAFPHVHFSDDRRPVSATVLSGLGRGRGHGRLSLHLSGGPPGAGAHLLVDLTGYLLPD
ncbi:MAG TPA: glycosyltransferase [Acidimicrobiales bacterium]|nr:glycosyltransferase [Acidimicrobiales bacterium]